MQRPKYAVLSTVIIGCVLFAISVCYAETVDGVLQPKFFKKSHIDIPQLPKSSQLARADSLVRKALLVASRGIIRKDYLNYSSSYVNASKRHLGHFGVLPGHSHSNGVSKHLSKVNKRVLRNATLENPLKAVRRRNATTFVNRVNWVVRNAINRASHETKQNLTPINGSRRHLGLEGLFKDLTIDVPNPVQHSYNVQIVPGPGGEHLNHEEPEHPEIFPWNEGGPSGPVHGLPHPIVAEQHNAEHTAGGLLHNAETLKLHAAEYQSKAKELENQAQVLHHQSGGPDVIAQHAPVVDPGHAAHQPVALPSTDTAAAAPAVAAAAAPAVAAAALTPAATSTGGSHNAPVTAGHAVAPAHIEPSVPVKLINTGYPVYHLPHRGAEFAVPEYIKPLPPLYGPNPYEVLTSSNLNGTTFKTHGLLAPLAKDQIMLPTAIKAASNGHNPYIDIPRSETSSKKKKKMKKHVSKRHRTKTKHGKRWRRSAHKHRKRQKRPHKRDTFFIDIIPDGKRVLW